MELEEVCEQISSINTSEKTELYENACAIFDSFQNGELPDELPLTTQAFTNLLSDLTAKDEELQVTATHLFLVLLHLSSTATPRLSERTDAWTVPFHSFLEDESRLVQTCFPFLGSTNTVSQQRSLKIVKQRIERIKSWSVGTNKEAQLILMQIVENCVLPRLEKMLGEPERQEVLAMKIWQQLIHSIGNYIPQTNHDLINRLLKLIEFCFKNTRQEVQLCAYTSWSILIQTFSLHRTYLVKKLRLFNVPLLSCAVKQEHRYAIVDVERAKTWRQLMLSLMSELQDHANTVFTPFFLFCIGLDPKMTLCKKFSETFKAHFSSLTTSDNTHAHRTASQVLASIENNSDFMTLLSSLNTTQHLPKKAVSDPETVFDWRKRLCTEGIYSLFDFLSIEFHSNQNLSAVRDMWLRDNYRVLLTLIGLGVHFFEPSEGYILAECFRQIICTLTSSGEGVDTTDLLYPSLVIIQTALANNHTPHTVVSLLESVCTSLTAQLSLPLCDSTSLTVCHVFTELLLDTRILQAAVMPEAFHSLYKQLINCVDSESRGLEQYQHSPVNLDVSGDLDALWRGWKITGETLLTILQPNSQEQEILSDHSQDSTSNQLEILGKSKSVHDSEAPREETSPKRIKVSEDASLNEEIDLTSTNCTDVDPDSIQIISSSETGVNSIEIAPSDQASFPCEEDPFAPPDSAITLLDDKDYNNDVTAIATTPDRSHDTSNYVLKPQVNSYSEQKLKLKQSKFLKIPVSDKSKSKGNWPHSPNEKEKKAFFKLELTPIRLEELPKSSPTHTSVNRKLQFPPGTNEQHEVVPALKYPPEVQVLDVEFEPTRDEPITTSDVQEAKIDSTHIDLDSIDEFIKDIPLSEIISPDELQSMNDNDDITASQSTNSLIVLSSCSLTQSVTPPTSQTETPSNPISEADSILAFNNCIQVENDSQPVVSSVNEEPMDIVEEKEEEQANNISIESVTTQDDVLGSSALVNELSPEASTTQSSNQFNTPKQSILKKQSTFSPSPNYKKVSFANPIHKTHAISASPRNRKFRNQKQNSVSQLTSATTSIGTRRAPRLGATGPVTNPEDPVCGALLDCTESVEVLIPFLTSQSVSRGITGLLKAKKIHTIGDLALLNEREAEALPIQPPKLQTLRTAFSKYQVTQFGIPGDLTRQSNNPLFFPLVPAEEQNTGQEDQIGEEQDQVVPFRVSGDINLVNTSNTDSVSVSIPEYPMEERDTTPEFVSTSVQTDSIPSTMLVNELASSLPGELQTLSQEQLTTVLTSLCQLIPSIADKFQPK